MSAQTIPWKRGDLLLRFWILLTILLTMAWAGSYFVPTSIHFTQGQYAVELSNRQGSISASVFREIAEDEFFRQYRIVYWTLELAVLILMIGTLWAIARRRKRTERQGFPVN